MVQPGRLRGRQRWFGGTRVEAGTPDVEFGPGFRNLDELHQPDYDPVRDRDDFRKLHEEVDAASRTPFG
jgi:hypothetical protein